MAEKRFIKGLFKDTAAIDQPAGSWRYASNMVLNETDGAVSNEGGNELSGHLGDVTLDPIYTRVGDFKAKVVGKIEVDDDKVVLFIVDEKEQNTFNNLENYCRMTFPIPENGRFSEYIQEKKHKVIIDDYMRPYRK